MAQTQEIVVSLAPVQNALNSFWLLTHELPGGQDAPWIRRHREPAGQSAALTRLAAVHAGPLLPPEPLEDVPRFLREVEAVGLDRQSLAAAGLETLSDADLLQGVDALRAVWQELLAPEWRRVLPVLTAVADRVAARLEGVTRLGEVLPDGLQGCRLSLEEAKLIDQAERVILAPSPHLVARARLVQREQTLWVFFGPGAHPDLLRLDPPPRSELLARLQTLGDETCLDILALFARRDELAGQEIAAALDLTQPTASRHLGRLARSGFLTERRHGGAAKLYRLVPGHVAATMSALEQVISGQSQEAVTKIAAASGLDRFLDAAGRVRTWPSRQRDRIPVLEYLASAFEAGRTYSESEVNALLASRHTWNDPAYLRRVLFEERLLERTPDGAQYWLRERLP